MAQGNEQLKNFLNFVKESGPTIANCVYRFQVRVHAMYNIGCVHAQTTSTGAQPLLHTPPHCNSNGEPVYMYAKYALLVRLL